MIETMEALAAMPLINLVVFISGIIIAILITAKFLKDKKIKFGNNEISGIKTETRANEREIIKRQIHVARAVCANFRNLVPNRDNYNKQVIENICYQVADEIEDLILFNHISTDDEYIRTRFPVIWAVIDRGLNDNFTDEDKAALEKLTYDNFRELIKILLKIREERM